MDHTRRDFLRVTIAMVALPTVSACGGDDGGGDGGACSTSSTSISSNHGHTVNVPVGDILAGTPMSYTLTTALGHTHMITINANHITTLMAGGMITTSSTLASPGSDHSHSVTVRCT